MYSSGSWDAGATLDPNPMLDMITKKLPEETPREVVSVIRMDVWVKDTLEATVIDVNPKEQVPVTSKN